jgi:RNA polymerase sigma-70 factor (ECF subfamily)
MFRRLCSKKADTLSIDGSEAMQFSSDERVDELVERAETGHALIDAVKSLGEPDSTIIMQKYYYGRNSADIADIVGMKPAAVRKRISRTMDKLKKILTDIGEGR